MNLFLISSPSYNQTQEEIKKISNNQGIISFDLEECGLAEVIEEANYISLFGDKKYLVISNAYIFNSDSIKEEDQKMFLEYLDHPSDSSVLIFTTLRPLDERKKVVKLTKEKGEVIVKKPLSEKDLIPLVEKKFKEHNKNITLKAINQIIELCQANYDLILQEINKLLIYFDDKDDIDEKKIINIVSDETLVNNFNFSDAVIAKNMPKAFKIFDVLKENKEEPVMLIGLLASQYRLIYTAKYYLNKNYNKAQITSELKIHPYRVELAINNSHNYSEKELLNKICLLADLDFNIKSGQVDNYAGLEMFLLEL